MPAARVIRWGFGLSLAAVALARYIGNFQRPLQDDAVPTGPETFCYQSVRTQSSASGGAAADCFTVRDGVFTAVFSSADASPSLLEPRQTKPGHVIPGLWDGHGHLLPYGEFLHSVDLFGSTTVDEVRQRLRDFLDANPGVGTKKQWIRGIGWDQMALGQMPTASLLEGDDSLKGLYMMLDRVDVHCTWVSQAVLSLLPDGVPDVPGGEIIRDPGMGVFCDNAMTAVYSLWPKPTAKRKKELLRTAMAALHEVGLVGMHDAGVLPADLQLYEEMAGTDDWTLRVYAMVECPERNTFCPEAAPRIADKDGFLTVRSVKLFADGALGSWGSAMIEPYSDRPETSGSLLVNASALTHLAKAWSAAGFQVNIHAIGDLANRYAIDAMEAALRDLCPEARQQGDDGGEPLADCQARRRFRIEHAQIIHPDDQARLRRMHIIPSIQPTHATSDMKYAALRLGEARTAAEAYRMRSLLDIKPVLGSDFPVEPPDPFQGIFAAVARRSPHTGRGADGGTEAWHMEEALTLDQALRGFTTGAAYAGFMEGRAGLVQAGAFADWVVLDKPIEEYDIDELRSMKVKETWTAGRRVYSRE